MSDQDSSSQGSRSTIGWIVVDAEAIVGFLVGVATLGFGTLALARWVLESWQLGVRLPAIGMAMVAIVAPVVFLFAVRRRRIVALTVAFFWLGSVAGALASQGFSLPASWFS